MKANRTPIEQANLRLTEIIQDAKERGITIVYTEMAKRVEARHRARVEAMVEDAIPFDFWRP